MRNIHKINAVVSILFFLTIFSAGVAFCILLGYALSKRILVYIFYNSFEKGAQQ